MIGTLVKFKRADTGKYWIAGKILQAKNGNGHQLGMKLTPELKAYIDNIPPGAWLNFSLFEGGEFTPKESNEDKINF